VSVVKLSANVLNIVMPSIEICECRQTEYHHSEYHHAEYHHAEYHHAEYRNL
jgi:hypothetical protein